MAGIGVQDHRNHCSGSRNPRSRSRNRCSRWIGISVQDGPEYALTGADLRGVDFGNTDLSETSLKEANLRDAKLENVKSLKSEQMAGADLTGAKLPEAVAEFDALKVVSGLTTITRKIFIGVLSACFYCLLTAATTTAVGLLGNTESSPLPIIQESSPFLVETLHGSRLVTQPSSSISSTSSPQSSAPA